MPTTTSLVSEGNTKQTQAEGAAVMMKHSEQPNDSVQAGNHSTLPPLSRISLWVSIVVILGAVLTIVGAVISKVDPALLTNGSSVTDAARVYADYTFSRNLSLAILLIFLLVTSSRRMLAGFMVLTALIQIIDVFNDLSRGDFLLVPGLLVFAIVFLFGASSLFKQALWRVDAWHE